MQRILGNRGTQRVLGVRSVAPTDARAGGERAAAPTGLPGPLRAAIERMSGESLADVRVHYDSPEPARLDAHAYTRGADIHMGPAQERHLPHEAWHVAQQKQGRVQPTTRRGGHLVNDDAALEREADAMGDRAAARRSGPLAGEGLARSSGAGAKRGRDRPVVQRLSATRDPRDGMQVKLETKKWSRGWELALFDKDGKGRKLCEIHFLLETSFMGSKPKLSVDSMQSHSTSPGAGTALLKNIPWAIQQIVAHNPLATRWGSLRVHSGFANIIAFQMGVKQYADALMLRGSPLWQERLLEAQHALEPDLEDDTEDSVSEAPLTTLTSRRPPKKVYDMDRFPELWADTQVVIASGLFDIDASRLVLTDVDRTVRGLRTASGLFGLFGASIDIKDLSELSKQATALQEQAKKALVLDTTPDPTPDTETAL